jgi:hypothetical protein
MNTRMRSWSAGSGQMLFAEARLLTEKVFRRTDIPAVRCLATSFGARAGMASARLADFTLAVSEAAACATGQGPCTARLRLWTTGPRAFCEIRGDGRMLRRQEPAGVRHGDAETLRRWLLQQVCDQLRLESGPGGVTVRFSVAVI